MGQTYSQLFPPAATLTEKNLPDQSGKVFIVTGASRGIGKELAQILYSHNAKVYIAARSSEAATQVVESIKSAFPESTGGIEYFHLDLSDLSTIKKSAQEFLDKEKRLDVLWNNAGVMISPQGSKTKQGYELQLGTNNIGPFLFTKLLTPILQSTAKTVSPGSVRVVWLSSSVAEAVSPKGGVDMGNLDYKVDKSAWHKYGLSKAGNILQAREFGRLHEEEGIVSVSLDPGNLKTNLQQHMGSWQRSLLNLLLHHPIQGAYTELFAGLSPDVKNGAWIAPWGRLVPLRKDINEASKTKENGGTGVGVEFWNWNEEQVKPFS